MYGLCFLEFSCLQKKLLKHNLNRSDGKGKDWLTDKYLKVKNFRKGDVAKLKTEGEMSKLLQPQNGVGLSKEEKHSPFTGEQPDSKCCRVHVSIYMTFWKRQNCGAENRSVVTRVWGEGRGSLQRGKRGFGGLRNSSTLLWL